LPTAVVIRIVGPGEFVYPDEYFAQMSDPCYEPLLDGTTFGREAKHVEACAFPGHPQRVESFGNRQQLVANLGQQGQGRGNRYIGNDVRGVLQPQAIFHHTVFAGLCDDISEDLYRYRQVFAPKGRVSRSGSD
jgi:hypothetical protein